MTLKEARRQAGLTQQQLADQMRLSRQTVIFWEGGKYNMSDSRIAHAATILGIPAENIKQ